MRKATLIFIVLIAFINAIAQKLPSKKEQYDFLKWYIKYKNLIPLDSTLNFVQSSSNIDINNIPIVERLNKTEKKYLYKQVELLKTQTKLDSITLKKLILNSVNTSSNKYINYCSLPIFTSDKKIAIISWGIYCGILCGQQSVDVFKRTKDNKWKAVKAVVPAIMF